MKNIYFKKTFCILTQMRVNDNRVFFYKSKPLKAKKTKLQNHSRNT